MPTRSMVTRLWSSITLAMDAAPIVVVIFMDELDFAHIFEQLHYVLGDFALASRPWTRRLCGGWMLKTVHVPEPCTSKDDYPLKHSCPRCVLSVLLFLILKIQRPRRCLRNGRRELLLAISLL